MQRPALAARAKVSAGRLRPLAATASALLVLGLVATAPAAAAAPTWLAPLDLSAAGQSAEEPQVAVDPQGDATAVWKRYNGSNDIIQSSSRAAGGTWSAPLDLSAAGQDADEPQVAVDPQGDATVVWKRFNGSRYIIQSAERPAGGAWSAPLDLSEAGQHAEKPQVAVDSQGDATAVWQRSNGSNYIVQSAERPAGGAWSAPLDLSETGETAERPQVAVDAQGDATAVWERYSGSNEIIQSAQRPAGGEWSAPLNLSVEGQDAYEPQVAVDPQGNATAVWERYNGSNEIIQSAARPAGGTWSAPQNLSEEGHDAFVPQVAVDPQGNATAVWKRFNGSNDIIQSSSRAAGGTWSAPLDLSEAGQSAEEPQVAVDPQGNATAVWKRFNGSKYIIQAAGYDAAGPLLHSLSIPATGTAGQPLAFSVSPVDVWSALGATSWSFGDGGSASGTAVNHTYAAAGTYEVTLRSADALGNTSSDSGTIAIAPAPSRSVRRGTAFAAHLARVKHGRALLRLRCRGGGRCRGLVKLLLGRKLIGKARFRIALGKAKVIRIRLNRRGKKLLHRARRHRLKVKLRGRGVRSRTVLVKQVQRQRRKR